MNLFRQSTFDRRPASGRSTGSAPPNFHNDSDFPGLPVSKTTDKPIPTSSSLPFSHVVSQKSEPLPRVAEEVLPPGVVRYTLHKRSRQLTVDEQVTEPVDESILDSQRFLKMHATLQQNYCDHAEHFIECYGYDCYERTFLMPNYDNSYFSDDSDWSSESDESE